MLKHEQMSAEYEKRIAALEAENAELRAQMERASIACSQGGTQVAKDILLKALA